MARIVINVDKGAIQELSMKSVNVRTKPLETQGMGDTGASVCLGGPSQLRSLGITESHLTKCDMVLYGADSSDIGLIGVIPVVITDRASGRQTRQFLYICKKSPRNMLLSLEACIDLGYVSPSFPSAQERQEQAVASHNDNDQSVNRADIIDQSVNRAGKKPDCDCNCPVRSTAPDVPTQLPFEATEENLDKLEQWIVEYYSASAFNQGETAFCLNRPFVSNRSIANIQ